MSGDEALLKWVQAALEGADDVEISSFNEGWADGRALCAIISHVRPRKRKSVGWARQRGADLVGGVALVTGGVPDMLLFCAIFHRKKCGCVLTVFLAERPGVFFWLHCPALVGRTAAQRFVWWFLVTGRWIWTAQEANIPCPFCFWRVLSWSLFC